MLNGHNPILVDPNDMANVQNTLFSGDVHSFIYSTGPVRSCGWKRNVNSCSCGSELMHTMLFFYFYFSFILYIPMQLFAK